MFKSLNKIIFLISLVILLLSAPLSPAQAELNIGQGWFKKIAETAGFQTNSVMTPTYLDTSVGKIIAIILGLVGSLFFIMIVISGFQWLTAGGNEENAKKARDRVISAVVGFAIVLAAYAITYSVYNLINKASRGEPSGGNEYTPGYECYYNSDCLDPTEPFCAWYDSHSFCVLCLEDNNCIAPTPYCLATLFGHSCVECKTDSHCGAGRYCCNFSCSNTTCVEFP